jgi:hypothetical protein
MSIIQLYLKRKHRWTDASFNEQCALNHSSRGPGNFYPRSLWLMKKIASVAEAHSIQVGLSCAGWGAGLAFSQVVVTIAPLSGSGAQQESILAANNITHGNSSSGIILPLQVIQQVLPGRGQDI